MWLVFAGGRGCWLIKSPHQIPSISWIYCLTLNFDVYYIPSFVPGTLCPLCCYYKWWGGGDGIDGGWLFYKWVCEEGQGTGIILLLFFFTCAFLLYSLMSSVPFLSDSCCVSFFVVVFFFFVSSRFNQESLVHRNCCVCHLKLFKKSVSDHYSVDFLVKGRVLN